MAYWKTPMLTLNEILEKSRKAHGDRYDYSLTDKSFGSKTVMKIICKVHGVFEKQAKLHYEGSGCYECGREYSNLGTGGSRLYICYAKEKHGERYDYSKSQLIGNNTKITITCNQC